MMTNQPVFIFVIGHLGAAMKTFGVPAAIVTEDHRSITPAVQKQQDLIIFFQGSGDLMHQCLRYGASEGFITKTYEVDFR